MNKVLWFELYFEHTKKALEPFEQKTDKIVLKAMWDGLAMWCGGEGDIKLGGRREVVFWTRLAVKTEVGRLGTVVDRLQLNGYEG